MQMQMQMQMQMHRQLHLAPGTCTCRLRQASSSERGSGSTCRTSTRCSVTVRWAIGLLVSRSENLTSMPRVGQGCHPELGGRAHWDTGHNLEDGGHHHARGPRADFTGTGTTAAYTARCIYTRSKDWTFSLLPITSRTAHGSTRGLGHLSTFWPRTHKTCAFPMPYSLCLCLVPVQ